MDLGLGFGLIYYILHALAGTLVPLLILSMIGCTKIKEKDGNLGEEVSVEAINNALQKAYGQPSFRGLRLGQSVKYSITRRLENEESTLTLGGLDVEVSRYQDLPTEERFTFLITKSTRLENGEFEVRESEQEYVFNKELSAEKLALQMSEARVGAQESKIERTSFHKLRESSGVISPPKQVRDRPDCGGLSPCELPVNYLQFNMVNWYSDGSTQKIAFDFAFSPATPVLSFGQDLFELLTGVLVTDCRSTYVPIEKRTVYVRDCQSLEDFQK